MSVKVMKGFISSGSGYREVKAGASQNAQSAPQTNSISTTAAATSQAIALHGRTLSDAVVTSVKGKVTGTSEKIREFREAKEVSNEVAEKIRDTDQGVDAHEGLETYAGRTHLAN